MARFFFHLVLPGDYQVDDVGSEFPDIEAAWLGGWEAAIEIIADMLRGRRDPNGLQFEIADEQGHFLMELPFSEVLRPAGRGLARPGIGSEISRQIRRNRVLKDEIEVELTKSRLLLELSHATLLRSRVA